MYAMSVCAARTNSATQCSAQISVQTNTILLFFWRVPRCSAARGACDASAARWALPGACGVSAALHLFKPWRLYQILDVVASKFGNTMFDLCILQSHAQISVQTNTIPLSFWRIPRCSTGRVWCIRGAGVSPARVVSPRLCAREEAVWRLKRAAPVEELATPRHETPCGKRIACVQSGTRHIPPTFKRRSNRRRFLQALRVTTEWVQCWPRRLPPRRASAGRRRKL